MVTFSAALAQVKQHVEQCLPEEHIYQVCREVGHQWRDRKLGPVISVHLIVLQLLAKVSLRGLRHVAGLCVSAQAVCLAKKRLPVQLFLKLIQHSVPRGLSGQRLYRQLRVYIADGMGFMTADTPELARRYGKSKNQQGPAYGYPTPKLLALVQAGGGFITKAIILPWKRQEFACLSRLFKAMEPGSLLLGDRGLVSFAHVALLIGQGLHGCFRLPRWQVVRGRGKANRRLVKRLGKQDLQVRWTACRRPDWLSERRWAAIKDQPLILRQISFRVCRDGFRTRWAWIVTTLLDERQYPAQELIELYSERWQIEVHFRDLKRTLKMAMVSAKTVAGVQKEVLAFILLYNLVRKVMHEAAVRQGVEPDRISFVDAARWLLYSPPGSPPPQLIVNPRRTRKTQPRKLKTGRRRYSQLKQSRAELCKPPCEVRL